MGIPLHDGHFRSLPATAACRKCCSRNLRQWSRAKRGLTVLINAEIAAGLQSFSSATSRGSAGASLDFAAAQRPRYTSLRHIWQLDLLRDKSQIAARVRDPVRPQFTGPGVHTCTTAAACCRWLLLPFYKSQAGAIPQECQHGCCWGGGISDRIGNRRWCGWSLAGCRWRPAIA